MPSEEPPQPGLTATFGGQTQSNTRLMELARGLLWGLAGSCRRLRTEAEK